MRCPLQRDVPQTIRNCDVLGTPPAGTEGSRPFGPGTQKSPKRVSRGLRPRGAPESPKSAPRSPKRVQKSPKLRFWTLFGLRGALFGDSGAPRGRRPRDTLSDSFRTLLGFRARRAREPSVPGGGVPNDVLPGTALVICGGGCIVQQGSCNRYLVIWGAQPVPKKDLRCEPADVFFIQKLWDRRSNVVM